MITAPAPARPSNPAWPSAWSSTWTASRFSRGSVDGPFGTAHDLSTPPASRRKSKWSDLAWCCWITNRTPTSCRIARRRLGSAGRGRDRSAPRGADPPPHQAAPAVRARADRRARAALRAAAGAAPADPRRRARRLREVDAARRLARGRGPAAPGRLGHAGRVRRRRRRPLVARHRGALPRLPRARPAVAVGAGDDRAGAGGGAAPARQRALGGGRRRARARRLPPLGGGGGGRLVRGAPAARGPARARDADRPAAAARRPARPRAAARAARRRPPVHGRRGGRV